MHFPQKGKIYYCSKWGRYCHPSSGAHGTKGSRGNVSKTNFYINGNNILNHIDLSLFTLYYFLQTPGSEISLEIIIKQIKYIKHIDFSGIF